MPNHLHSQLSDSVEDLSPAKLKLLNALLSERAHAVAPAALPLVPSSFLRENATLSFPQERMWFLQLFDPHSPAYIISKAIRIKGPLQIDILEMALTELIRRHSVLRTIYREENGVPRSYICASTPFQIPIRNLDSLSETDKQLEIGRLADLNQDLPFDLDHGPVIRFSAVQVGAQDHVILFAVHHIAFDGWSMNLLFAELPALYQHFLQGEREDLGAQSIQYADYAEWQHAWIEGAEAQRQLQYWLKQLMSVPTTLALQQAVPDPLKESSAGGRETFTLNDQLLARIHSFATRHRLTSYMVYLAALMILLHKYTGQTDICIGTPIANRGRSETHNMIGMLVNTLVMRASVLGAQPVGEFLQAIRTTVLDGLSHQEYPFERIVKALSPERAVGKHPLFQTMLVLQNGMSNELQIPDCEVSFIEARPRTPIFDLTVTLAEEGSQGFGWIEFNRAKFDQRFVEGIAGHYRHLLEQLVSYQEGCIHDLTLLTPGELQERSEWNDTTVEYSSRTVPDAIMEQCLVTPGAIAVIDGKTSLTYERLSQEADHLAAYLRTLGVTSETTVGICAERSAALPIALLGILRAGGAYLPLDPSYPTQRLDYMVKDSEIKVLVTARQELTRHFPGFEGEIVSLDRDKELISAANIATSQDALNPTSAMYVMYTSGSTGHPKGVINTHEGISNRLQWMNRAHPGMGTGRVLQKTSISFDVSVWELFLPLMYGGTLVLAKPGAQADAEYLAQTIHTQKIETVHFVPSMLRNFLSVDNIEQLCTSLKWLICSGEELTRDLMERCSDRLPAHVCNLYGPTEAAIDVTSWRCLKEWSGIKLPIGRPIDNMQIHILGQGLKPVPTAVIGELYIGGVGVARGYVKRPDLTAERFLPDPFSDLPGARMYRTGDLGCYTREGEILFYGRSDHQVKIRGNRIELEEIEAVCRTCDGVDDARTIALEYAPTDVRIVAYVVSTLEKFDEQALRTTLKAALPTFMLPAAIVRLNELPLTASQKLDRAKLPKPQNFSQDPANAQSPLRDHTDGKLMNIWRSVLNASTISPDDNFFDLGGHSLLLAQVKRLIEHQLGADITMLDLFAYPTLRSLSAYLATKAPAPLK